MPLTYLHDVNILRPSLAVGIRMQAKSGSEEHCWQMHL